MSLKVNGVQVAGRGRPGADGYTPQKGVDYFDGEKGADGKSAYKAAQEGGYAGTEDEFNALLAGIKDIGGADVYDAVIGINWTEDSETGVKTQTVLIPNSSIDEDSTAKVDHSSESVDGTSEGYATFVEEENQYLTYITNGFAETVAGGIKFTIFGDPNTVSIPIVVEVV